MIIMPSLDQVMEEIILLTEKSHSISLGTKSDYIYQQFTEAPYLSPEDADEGMWYVANTKLDNVFGLNEGPIHIRKGPCGLQLVVNWIREAQKNEKWDSEADQAKKQLKKTGWDSASDQLVKVKMEKILTHVKGTFPSPSGCLFPRSMHHYFPIVPQIR